MTSDRNSDRRVPGGPVRVDDASSGELDDARRPWSVGEVAGLSGVSVRTLHHYDRIGLLHPGRRTTAGHRHYGQADIARLQRILAYRELGFSLVDIGRLLDDPDADPVERLRRQHGLVLERMERLAQIAAVLERTMEAHTVGIKLTAEEMLEVFGDHDPAQHAEEVEERWGDTDSYRQSQQRTSQYSKEDWQRIQAGQEAVGARFAAVMAAGRPAGSDEAMDAAEAHRQHISRYFYEVSPQTHIGLAEMYVADPRFTEYYERTAPGLAQFVHDAILANAARQE
jgi:MerR family transcriptional regulator, thiopeptide resistance regulator